MVRSVRLARLKIKLTTGLLQRRWCCYCSSSFLSLTRYALLHPRYRRVRYRCKVHPVFQGHLHASNLALQAPLGTSSHHFQGNSWSCPTAVPAIITQLKAMANCRIFFSITKRRSIPEVFHEDQLKRSKGKSGAFRFLSVLCWYRKIQFVESCLRRKVRMLRLVKP